LRGPLPAAVVLGLALASPSARAQDGPPGAAPAQAPLAPDAADAFGGKGQVVVLGNFGGFTHEEATGFELDTITYRLGPTNKFDFAAPPELGLDIMVANRFSLGGAIAVHREVMDRLGYTQLRSWGYSITARAGFVFVLARRVYLWPAVGPYYAEVGGTDMANFGYWGAMARVPVQLVVGHHFLVSVIPALSVRFNRSTRGAFTYGGPKVDAYGLGLGAGAFF
jgi:hypothetical protein